MRIPRAYLLVLVAMCCMVAAAVGLMNNVQGLFFGPMSAELGVSRGAVSLTVTLASICGGIGGTFSARLLASRRMRPLIAAATATGALATAALGLAGNVYLIYGLCIVRGLCSGLLGVVLATQVLNNWYMANIGLVTSIAMGCSGVAGSAFSILFSNFIDGFGWRVSYFVMAGTYALLMLPTILFLPAGRPEEVRLVPFGVDVRSAHGEGRSSVADSEASQGWTLAGALVIAFGLFTPVTSSLAQHLPGIATSYGLDVGVGATMLSVCMLSNTFGKVAFGALCDCIGTRRTTIVWVVLVMAALVGMLALRVTGALVMLSVLYGLCFSFNTVAIPMVARDVCGAAYAKVYPVAVLAVSCSYAVLASVHGYLYDATGGYALSLVLAMASLVVALVIMLAAYRWASKAPANHPVA